MPRISHQKSIQTPQPVAQVPQAVVQAPPQIQAAPAMPSSTPATAAVTQPSAAPNQQPAQPFKFTQGGLFAGNPNQAYHSIPGLGFISNVSGGNGAIGGNNCGLHAFTVALIAHLAQNISTLNPLPKMMSADDIQLQLKEDGETATPDAVNRMHTGYNSLNAVLESLKDANKSEAEKTQALQTFWNKIQTPNSDEYNGLMRYLRSCGLLIAREKWINAMHYFAHNVLFLRDQELTDFNNQVKSDITAAVLANQGKSQMEIDQAIQANFNERIQKAYEDQGMAQDKINQEMTDLKPESDAMINDIQVWRSDDQALDVTLLGHLAGLCLNNPQHGDTVKLILKDPKTGVDTCVSDGAADTAFGLYLNPGHYQVLSKDLLPF